MQHRLFLSAITIALVTLAATDHAYAGPRRRPCIQRYQGTWSSDCTTHHGRLSARVGSNCGGTCQVRFCGTFFGVVPFVYSVPMTVTGYAPDGSTLLYGRSHLPLFGEFTCHARMNDRCFTARYWSENDQGQFIMDRR